MVITKSNKLNHENTELYLNDSLNKNNPFYRTCVSCKRVKKDYYYYYYYYYYKGKKCKSYLNN